MSLARIYTQKFSGKSKNVSTCEHCHEPIVKGESYSCFKVGFRSRYQHNYHARCASAIRDSMRESSKMAGVYSAREDATDNVNNETYDGDPSSFVSSLQGHLESAADEWDSVAEEYRDAAESSATGLVFGVDLNESADSIEEAANSLRDWNPDNDEPDVEHEDHRDDDDERTGIVDDCDECQNVVSDWVDETTSSALDALTDAEGEIQLA